MAIGHTDNIPHLKHWLEQLSIEALIGMKILAVAERDAVKNQANLDAGLVTPAQMDIGVIKAADTDALDMTEVQSAFDEAKRILLVTTPEPPLVIP